MVASLFVAAAAVEKVKSGILLLGRAVARRKINGNSRDRSVARGDATQVGDDLFQYFTAKLLDDQRAMRNVGA